MVNLGKALLPERLKLHKLPCAQLKGQVRFRHPDLQLASLINALRDLRYTSGEF
jgi:hypothetical protein